MLASAFANAKGGIVHANSSQIRYILTPRLSVNCAFHSPISVVLVSAVYIEYNEIDCGKDIVIERVWNMY